MNKNIKIWAKVLLLIFLVVTIANLIVTKSLANTEHSNEVIPIEWNEFDNHTVDDKEYELINEIMINSTKYILNTWYEENNYHTASGLLDFGGNGHDQIRGPAMAVLGASIPLATDSYDYERVGLPFEEAVNRSVLLINSLVSNHYINNESGWGYNGNPDSDNWQTPLWTYYTGFSGWLLWEHFNNEEQEQIRRMVEWEANNIPEPRYYKDKDGNVLYNGNTQAEENSSWVSLLALAISMMPRHENAGDWVEQMIDLSLVAFAKPTDITSDKQYNNRVLSEVLEGSNIENNGTVVNHRFLHPIYMLTIEQNLNVALLFSLAQLKTPESIFHNSSDIYFALTDLQFDKNEYLEPGGTIYKEGSSHIYYPEGNDWGEHFPMYFGQIDVLASVFSFDDKSSYDAKYWSKLHNEEQLRFQNRFEDGRTYKNDLENNFSLKEERIAQIASTTFLTKWLERQGAYSISDANFDNFLEVHIPYQEKLATSQVATVSVLLLLLILIVADKIYEKCMIWHFQPIML